jgi:hypothetical protein
MIVPMIVSMASDIHPICDKDKSPMKHVVYDMPDIALANIHVFVCQMAGCTRHFEHGRGYFDVIDRRFRPDANAPRVCCPDDTLPMFLESVAEDGRRHWRCAQLHCEQSQITEPS